MVERRDRRVRGSYLTFTQLALASTRPPQLKAMALGVWGAERRALYYPGGAFSLDRLAWAFVIENQERPLASVRTPLRVRRALAPAFAHLPLLDADTVAVGHPVGFYRDSVQHDQPGDPYWTPTDFRPALRDLGIPATMIGGWYDMSLPSVLADYQALREGGQTARLRVGPWHHSSQDLFRYSFQDALEWFGAHLLGGPAPPWSSVRIETMGGGGWRDLPQWPLAASMQRWHLQPHGALAIPVPPAGEPGRYTYDPADPTPAVGGTSSSPANAGPKDNRELERRPDVLTYTSEPLPSALEITGPVTAELFVPRPRLGDAELHRRSPPRHQRNPHRPEGGGSEAFAAAADIAAVAAETLLNPDAHAGACYALTGPQALTFDDVAAIIAAVSGRPVG